MTNNAPFYPYSAEYAKSEGMLDVWRESHRANMACRDAIEESIREGFDGMHLDHDCAEKVMKEFGFARTKYVLANTLKELEHDGRFSRDNKAWGRQTFVDRDRHNTDFVVRSHPAVLDGFIREFREEVQKLGLFGREHCPEDGRTMDYEGKVLVMRPDVLSEAYLEPKYQLWYAHDGFGCSPTAIGRSIRATCLADGEMSRWNRADFYGPIKEELLPDWAREQTERLHEGEQLSEPQKSEGPEMKM